MNKLIIVFAAVIGVEFTLAEVCPNGGKSYKNKCYIFHPEQATWDDAVAKCKKSMSELVGNIADKSENDFITSIAEKKVIWIAFNKIGHTTQFLWRDGSKAAYLNWGINEPNNARKNEYCVELISSPTGKNSPGAWNDNPCAFKHSFVCTYKTGKAARKTDGTNTACANGGKSYKNKCFVFHPEEKCWDEAKEVCQKSGSDLVSNIADKAENDFIASIGEKKVLWTGLNKIGHTKEFLWLDSSKPSFTYWGPHEPNNFAKNEYCVELYSNGYPPWKYPVGAWNDNPCNNKHPFVCQYIEADTYTTEIEIIYY